jgi:hypothetical protein
MLPEAIAIVMAPTDTTRLSIYAVDIHYLRFFPTLLLIYDTVHHFLILNFMGAKLFNVSSIFQCLPMFQNNLVSKEHIVSGSVTSLTGSGGRCGSASQPPRFESSSTRICAPFPS